MKCAFILEWGLIHTYKSYIAPAGPRARWHSALKRLDFFLYFIVFSISQPTKIQVGCPICSHNSSNFMQLLSRAPAGHNTWWEFKLGSFFDTTAIKKCEDYKSLQGSRSLFYNIFAEVKKTISSMLILQWCSKLTIRKSLLYSQEVPSNSVVLRKTRYK